MFNLNEKTYGKIEASLRGAREMAELFAAARIAREWIGRAYEVTPAGACHLVGRPLRAEDGQIQTDEPRAP